MQPNRKQPALYNPFLSDVHHSLPRWSCGALGGVFHQLFRDVSFGFHHLCSLLLFFLLILNSRVLFSRNMQVAVYYLASLRLMDDSYIPDVVGSNQVSRDLFSRLFVFFNGELMCKSHKTFAWKPFCRERLFLVILFSILVFIFLILLVLASLLSSSTPSYLFVPCTFL